MLHSLLLGTGAIVGIVIGVIVLILIIAAISIVVWWFKTRNAYVRLKNSVEEAWATIDVYLKKRFDLIPNLVETVKGFAAHESDTLKEVVAARNIAMNASTTQQKIDAANNLTSSLKTFFNVVQESYPQLQANQNFLDLQNQLKNIEDELESARRYYNGVVKAFNTKLEIFPSCIVANHMGSEYTKKEYFEVTDPVERRNVQVKF